MQIAIGSDHRGVNLRRNIIEFLLSTPHEVLDLGTSKPGSIDYPEVAASVARLVSLKKVDTAILICGTGIGMCITANRFPGVRAAPCHDDLTVELSRRHNDANILCLSGDMLSERHSERLVKKWLTTQFDGGRHATRLEKIEQIEQCNHHHKCT
jgi:ribose 5-phosphate isomerase B